MNTEFYGMSTFFRGITKTVPSLFPEFFRNVISMATLCVTIDPPGAIVECPIPCAENPIPLGSDPQGWGHSGQSDPMEGAIAEHPISRWVMTESVPLRKVQSHGWHQQNI
jgi:hypothetical protein